MPFIEVLVFGRRLAPEQKRALLEQTNDAVQRVLGSTERQVRIALLQFPDEDFFDGSARSEHPDHI